MIQKIAIDIGPLIAYLNPNDTHHAWAIEVLSTVNLPLLSCEAVIAEAYFLSKYRTKNEWLAITGLWVD